MDLDVYVCALYIQQTVGNTNWFIQAGVLHIAFAALHGLGKNIDASGVDTCSTETGAYTSTAPKRGVDYHLTAVLAILMMLFDHILAKEEASSITDITGECINLRESLHDRSTEMNDTYVKVESWYIKNMKPHECDFTGIATFLTQYLQQVECLLDLITTCR